MANLLDNEDEILYNEFGCAASSTGRLANHKTEHLIAIPLLRDVKLPSSLIQAEEKRFGAKGL